MEMLDAILAKKGNDRRKAIDDFQAYIWNTESLPYEGRIVELLRTLAYDLDFAGTDEIIDREIKSVLQKMK